MTYEPINKNKCAHKDCKTSMSDGCPKYCPEHQPELSRCHNAPMISSGIPFDGTNSTLTKMCRVCGHC